MPEDLFARTGIRKLALWKQLAEAELGSYLNYLLEKQWMSGALAPGLLSSLAPEMEFLSLRQRRYIAWVGVREGAAAFLRFLGDPNKAYDSMIVDMRRRARWVANDPESSVEFVPAQGWRRPILLSLFIDEMTSLGEQYWRMVPTQSALDQFGRARPRKSA